MYMRVDPRDSRCRECGGNLTIIDFTDDDMLLTVECDACGVLDDIKTEALNDGAIHYLPTFLAERMAEGSEEL